LFQTFNLTEPIETIETAGTAETNPSSCRIANRQEPIHAVI
jgi:hypothetical protein